MIRLVRPQGAWVRARSRDAAVHGAMFGGALAITLIAWGPATEGWFLLDDYRWLLPSDRRFDVLRSFISTWGHGHAYRPVMRLSFLADLHLFGWDARGWHLHNLLLHAANVTLLFSLIREATNLHAPALAIAVLFAVSPLGHENVAWISGRTFLLGGACFLLSANLLLRSVRTLDAARGTRLFWCGAIAFVTAMATYEPTMVLPLLALAAVKRVPSLPLAPPALVARRLRQLFLVLIVFAVCRVILLRGHVGDVGAWTPFWIYEPLRWYVANVLLNGHPMRLIVPLTIATAWIASIALLWWRPSLAPSAARRVPAFLAIAACLLFLPFSTGVAIPDRFLYLLQAVGLAAVVMLLWLVARSSRAGAAVAIAATIVLAIAGAAECRQAAREWATAGVIARSIADDLHRRHPTWPNGTDIVLDAVPRRVGRGQVFMLYRKESVLQRYPDVRAIDASVYFGEELAASPELRARRRARSAKYFRFDARTSTLTELTAMEWERDHAPRNR